MQLEQHQSKRLLCNDLLEYCALRPEPYLPAMLGKVARVKAATQGVRIGDGFSHCASACVPKDRPMVHLLRLMKG